MKEVPTKRNTPRDKEILRFENAKVSYNNLTCL